MSWWSEEKKLDMTARVTELWEQGLGDREISAKLGISHQTVRKIRWAEDLPANDRRLMDPSREAERRSLYDAGRSDGEIASKQGVTSASILLWRRRNGLPANYAPIFQKEEGSDAT